ncbi:MAG TPA: PKD domain-containing protein [Thermoleophilaceae bacterium]|nr:PKD domain-containing protein [Thermoleophilaceae bacterium]
MTPGRGRLGALAGAATAALALATAVSASADPPTGDFTPSPGVGQPGQPVTFTSSGVADPEALPGLTVEWRFENGGAFVAGTPGADPFAATHTYATAGTRTVTMHIVDGSAEETFVNKQFRVNAPPNAAFGLSSSFPNVAQSVTFNAAPSTDDVQIPASGYDWDLDGDNQYDDATNSSVVSARYNSPGDRIVRLRVTDADGVSDTVAVGLHVNRPPAAAFIASTRSPTAGDTVDFTSISDDLDDGLASESWDLDGDGQFDDARGKTASRRFSLAGRYLIRLRAVDAHGRSDIASTELNVNPRPNAPLPERMNPWPVIRIVGFAGVRRTRIDLLSVKTTPGSLVKVRCRDKGCPRRSAISTRANRRIVRVRWLERRLRAGTRIAIAVTVPGRIGQYTVLTLRKKKSPRRRTLCLFPGDASANRCGNA